MFIIISITIITDILALTPTVTTTAYYPCFCKISQSISQPKKSRKYAFKMFLNFWRSDAALTLKKSLTYFFISVFFLGSYTVAHSFQVRRCMEMKIITAFAT
jgi:hypothetical protein